MAAEPNPVDPCSGWKEQCAFCTKRFGEWKEIGNSSDEEHAVTTVKPAAFMFAYKTKQGMETVSIGLYKPNSRQNMIADTLSKLKQRTANKSFKETKSTIHFRCAAVADLDSKDACTIYAHWCNYGVLPRLTADWPGTAILENSQHMEYSPVTKKWCYASKVPVWRHPKKIFGPRAVRRCAGWTKDCSFCEAHLTPWVSASQCISEKLAPAVHGIVVFAANSVEQQKREVVNISESHSLKHTINYDSPTVRHHLHSDCSGCGPCDKKKTTLDVRWIAKGNSKEEELSYSLVLAHWVNCNSSPRITKNCLGYNRAISDDSLKEHSQFVLRERDGQWCYVGDIKEIKFRVSDKRQNKNKEKRYVQSMVEEEMFE